MSFLLSQIRRTLLLMPVARVARDTLKWAKVALGFFIAVCVVAFLSLVIIATYFLIHLVQGR